MGTARVILKNFSYQAGGKVLSVVIGLAILAILTRALGPEGFGEYTTAVTFLQLFGVVVDFGLTLTLVVMISEKGADEEDVAGNILGLRLLSGAIMFALAPLAILPFPWSSTIKLGVAVGAIGYFLMSGAAILNGVFQKHAVMARAAVAELAGRVVLVALVGAFAFMNFGVVAMIAALIASNLIWFILMITLARPYVRVRPRFDWAMYKTVISRSWPIALSIIFNLLYLKGDILFLAYFREQIEVGHYGAAYRFLDVLTAVPVMFMGLLLPPLVRDWTQGNKAGFRVKLSKTFDAFMLFAIPVVVGAQAVAVPLVQFVAGDGYEPSAQVLTLLIIALLGIYLGALYGHTVVALNLQRKMILGYVLVAIVAVAGYLLFIPTYGMFAAAWVTIVSEVLIASITYAVVYKTSKAAPSLGVTLRALAASIAMYFVIVALPAWHVLILIAIGATVYGVIMLLIGGIRSDDLTHLLPARN